MVGPLFSPTCLLTLCLSHFNLNLFIKSFILLKLFFLKIEVTSILAHEIDLGHCEVTSLTLPDLSAAFDIVNHSIFLTWLQNWFYPDDLSYPISHSQAFSIIFSISVFSTISCEREVADHQKQKSLWRIFFYTMKKMQNNIRIHGN